MEYKINHLTLVEPTLPLSALEDELKNKISRFQYLVADYPKKLLLEIFVKKEGLELYVVTASLALKGKFVYAEEKGPKPALAGGLALDKLKGLVKKQLAAERKDYLYSRKYRSHARAENSRNLLEEQSRAEMPSSFIETLKEVVPELLPFVREEIGRKKVLRQLMAREALRKSNIADAVYLELYRSFRNNPDEPEKIIIWAYSVASKKIRELAEEYTGQYRIEEDLPSIPKKDGSDEEETLSVQGAPFANQLNQSNERFFGPYHYYFQEILTDAGAGDDMLINAESENEDLTIREILQNFPEEQQSVFELYYLHRFRIDEISRIKNIGESQVDHLVKGVRSVILQTVRSQDERVSISVKDRG